VAAGKLRNKERLLFTSRQVQAGMRNVSRDSSNYDFLYQDGAVVREGIIDPFPPPKEDFDSCYVFAFHKSGSVLINSITSALMNAHAVPVIDLPNYFFELGIEIKSVLLNCDRLFRPRGYCYLGFRQFFPCLQGALSERLRSAQKILLVRDPRDMLVSLYYSVKYSHFYPTKGTPHFHREVIAQKKTTDFTVDDFCIRWSGSYVDRLSEYDELIDDKCLVIKYEDIIYNKVQLAQSICGHFHLDISPQTLESLIVTYNEIPRRDRPQHHIRQAHPGDHIRKLQPKTIVTLNEILKGFLDRFGY